jgi:hypothetical protein
MYPQMKKPVGMLLLFNANSAILQLYQSCTMLFFVNITGFNSNRSSDWTIKK